MLLLQWSAQKLDSCHFWKSMSRKLVISMTSLGSIVLFIEEVVCRKLAGFADVMKVLVKAVNFILSHAFNHRQFRGSWQKLVHNITTFFISVKYVACAEERC